MVSWESAREHILWKKRWSVVLPGKLNWRRDFGLVNLMGTQKACKRPLPFLPETIEDKQRWDGWYISYCFCWHAPLFFSVFFLLIYLTTEIMYQASRISIRLLKVEKCISNERYLIYYSWECKIMPALWETV